MNKERVISLDIETTGLNTDDGHRIIEIGCVEILDNNITDKEFSMYINPERDVPIESTRIHGIKTSFLRNKPKFKEIMDDFMSFIRESTLVIHNAKFDLSFLNYELNILGVKSLENRWIDTMIESKKRFPGSPATLDQLCKKFNIDLSSRNKHGAIIDARLLAEAYINLNKKQEYLFEDIQENNLTIFSPSAELKVTLQDKDFNKKEFSESILVNTDQFPDTTFKKVVKRRILKKLIVN